MITHTQTTYILTILDPILAAGRTAGITLNIGNGENVRFEVAAFRDVFAAPTGELTASSEIEGVTLDQLSGLVVRARQHNAEVGDQLMPGLQQMAAGD